VNIKITTNCSSNTFLCLEVNTVKGSVCKSQ